MKSFLNRLDNFLNRHVVWLMPLAIFFLFYFDMEFALRYCPEAFEVFPLPSDSRQLTVHQAYGCRIFAAVCVGSLLCSFAGLFFKFFCWALSKCKKST